MERVLDEISFLAPDLIKTSRAESEGPGNVFDIAAAADGAATVPLPVTDRETATGRQRVVVIDPEYVRQMVASIVKDQDLSRYIL
jgi:ATP-dependent HslUV protease ATP-binding subunit HslU